MKILKCEKFEGNVSMCAVVAWKYREESDLYTPGEREREQPMSVFLQFQTNTIIPGKSFFFTRNKSGNLTRLEVHRHTHC